MNLKNKIAPHAYRTSVWFCFCGTSKTTSEYLRAKTSISLNLDNLRVASSSPQFLICRNRNLFHHNSWISTRLETYYKCERLSKNGIQNTVSSPFLLPGAWKLSFVNLAWARSSRMLKPYQNHRKKQAENKMRENGEPYVVNKKQTLHNILYFKKSTISHLLCGATSCCCYCVKKPHQGLSLGYKLLEQ